MRRHFDALLFAFVFLLFYLFVCFFFSPFVLYYYYLFFFYLPYTKYCIVHIKFIYLLYCCIAHSYLYIYIYVVYMLLYVLLSILEEIKNIYLSVPVSNLHLTIPFLTSDTVDSKDDHTGCTLPMRKSLHLNISVMTSV